MNATPHMVEWEVERSIEAAIAQHGCFEGTCATVVVQKGTCVLAKMAAKPLQPAVATCHAPDGGRWFSSSVYSCMLPSKPTNRSPLAAAPERTSLATLTHKCDRKSSAPRG